MVIRLLVALVTLVSASPAFAEGAAAAVAEGSPLTLVALGLLGVIIGRRASMGSVDKD